MADAFSIKHARRNFGKRGVRFKYHFIIFYSIISIDIVGGQTMKKIFTVIVFIISAFALAACSNQQSLDGKYYDQYDYLVLEIKGKQGTYHENHDHAITSIDFQKKTFTFSASGREYVATYDVKKDGTFTFDTGNFLTGSNKQIIYKKDSESYNKNVKND